MKIAIIGSSLEALEFIHYFKDEQMHLCLFSKLNPLEILDEIQDDQLKKKWQIKIQDLQNKFIFSNKEIIRIQKKSLNKEDKENRMADLFQVISNSQDLEIYEDFDFIVNTTTHKSAHHFIGGSQPTLNELIHCKKLFFEMDSFLKAKRSCFFEESVYLNTLLLSIKEDLINRKYAISLVSKKSFSPGLVKLVNTINEASYELMAKEDLNNFEYPVLLLEDHRVISVDKFEGQDSFFLTFEKQSSQNEMKTLSYDYLALMGAQITRLQYNDFTNLEEAGVYWIDYSLAMNEKLLTQRFKEIYEDIRKYFSSI